MSPNDRDESLGRPLEDRWIHRPDVWSGLVLGGALATRTFRPSLMPRATAHQALVSGASGAIGFGVANAVYGLTAHTGSTAGDLTFAAMTSAGGFAMSRVIPEIDSEAQWRPVARTVASALAAGGLAASLGVAVRGLRAPHREIAGAVLTAAALGTGAAEVVRGLHAQKEAHEQYDPPTPKPLPAVGQAFGVAALLSVLVNGFRKTSGVLANTLEQRIGVPEAASRWIGRGLTVPIWFGTGKYVADSFVSGLRVYDRVVDAGFDRAPDSQQRSSGEGSAVPFARLGREGRRFVLKVPTVEEIGRVMGQPAVAEPIRVFVGYDAAADDEARVALAMEELRRTRAFDRRMLVVGCAAGNGYVNTLPLEVLDYVLLGDTAAVSVQYGRLPSFLTLNRVTRGARVQQALLEQIRDELADRPPEQRPTVVVYGESLGAWAGQDTFLHRGVEGLDELGVRRALWAGTPYYSGWRREVLVDRSVPVEEGTVLEVGGPGPLLALGDEGRAKLRAVVVGHGNDPVRYLSAGLIVRKPDWLGSERAWGVPDHMNWLPAITTVQVIVDAVNATRPVPGVFRATGHEYNADLPDCALVAYGIEHPPGEVWMRLVEHLADVDKARASQARRRRKSDKPTGPGGARGRDRRVPRWLRLPRKRLAERRAS